MGTEEDRGRWVDLHAHTTASDGTLTPRQLVEYACQKELAAVAVTDHDTVGGVAEAQEAGVELGLEVVPGVELSSELEGCEIHIVGLFIRPDSRAVAELLAWRRAERNRRNQLLLERLEELGMPVTREELGEAELLTRTHIGEALARHGLARDAVDALERYLQPGKPAWIDKNGPSLQQCVQVIHRAGGLAFLAHIDRIDSEDGERSLALALRALDAGMDGLEVRYATYTREWEKRAADIARSRGLLPSGGSDFHGGRKANDLGAGLGNLAVPFAWLEAMKGELARRRASSHFGQ